MNYNNKHYNRNKVRDNNKNGSVEGNVRLPFTIPSHNVGFELVCVSTASLKLVMNYDSSFMGYEISLVGLINMYGMNLFKYLMNFNQIWNRTLTGSQPFGYLQLNFQHKLFTQLTIRKWKASSF